MLTIATFFITQLYCLIRGFLQNPALLFVGYIVIYFMYHEQRWWSNMIPTFGYSFFFSVIILLSVLFPKNRTPTPVYQLAPLKWFLAIICYFVCVQIWALMPNVHSYALENLVKVSLVIFAAFKL